MKKKNNNVLKWFVIIAIVAIVIVAAQKHFGTKTVVNDGITAVTDSFGDEKKLDEIRNRENIKKQQELIVKETYLNEEKASVQAAKEAAIAKFDAEIATLEGKLEGIRAEKLTFQSPLKQAK